MRERMEPEVPSLTERLVHLRRVAKTVTGGKKLSFSALVVVGDGQGRVGYGLGKGAEIPEAIRKASAKARKNLIRVPLKETTIPHEIVAKFGAAKVMLKPASPGTGVVAGRAVRAVVEAAGIKDVLSKILSASTNPINVVPATVKALSLLMDPEETLARRGKLKKAAEEGKVGSGA